MQKKHIKIPIGLRTIKTVVAVMISMIIVDAYGATTSKLLFAMLGAMAAVQTTFKESVKSSMTQIVGVFLGALAGVLLRALPMPTLLATGIGIMLVITVYNIAKIPFSPSLPCFIVVMVCTTPDIHPMYYALGRIWDSAIGLGVGMIINTLVFPYDNSQQIRSTVHSLDHELIVFLEDMFDGDDVLPDAEKMTVKIDDIARQLTIFANQRLPFKQRKQQQQLTMFRLCEGKARQLVSHMEVLSRIEKLGRLDSKNRQLLLKSCAHITEQPPIEVMNEADIVTNYHVHQILILRQELLNVLSMQDEYEPF